jgi:hypothetical protein
MFELGKKPSLLSYFHQQFSSSPVRFEQQISKTLQCASDVFDGHDTKTMKGSGKLKRKQFTPFGEELRDKLASLSQCCFLKFTTAPKNEFPDTIRHLT